MNIDAREYVHMRQGPVIKMERVMEQKIKKVVEARTDTPAMIEALEAIAVFYGRQQGGNTAEARKSLRQDLEKQNMALTNRFLTLLEGLRGRLESLEEGTDRLEEHCQAINQRTTVAEKAMSEFVSRSRELQKQRDQAYDKADKVSSFLEKFILSEAEVRALRSEPIDMVKPAESGVGEQQPQDEEEEEESPRRRSSLPFFAALVRVQQVRHECSKLVGSKHQSAGFELLETLSEHQEAGFRRLHEWILERCQQGLEHPAGLGLDDSAMGDVEETDAALSMGLKAIRERPALLVHCQECLLGRRREVMRRRFVVALTQGAGGSLRPIEMQAHDPVRYVGDMLAWTHQAIASEREFLHNLLGPEAKRPAHPPKQDSTEDGGEDSGAVGVTDTLVKVMSQQDLLAGIMEGMAQPIKMRIMQVLSPSTPLVLTFRLLNLLAFYTSTLANLLPPSSAPLPEPSTPPSSSTATGPAHLIDVLSETKAHCQRMFEAGLRSYGKALLASPPAYSMDLSAFPVTSDAGRQLSEILQVYESSLMPSSSSLGYDLGDLLSALIEPVLRMCRLSTEGLDPSDAAVLMLNNTALLQSSLTSHAAASSWCDELSGEVDTWLGLLVRYQTEAILDRCGLGLLLDKAQAVVDGHMGTLAAQPGLEPATVAHVMRLFYGSLFSLTQIERLQSPKIRTQARQRASLTIAEAHKKAYELFSEESSGYSDKTFLSHTPDEVRILLDVDEE